jgi:hypothetical protein
MILRKTLLIEKREDYRKRFYKSKRFWKEVEKFFDDYERGHYHDFYDSYYYEYCSSDEVDEMNYIFWLCDEENIIENYK